VTPPASAAAPGSRYWEVTVVPTAETAEGLTNFLWEAGALGVVEEDVEGPAPRLRAFFPETAGPQTLERGLRDYLDGLEALGLAVPEPPCVAPIADQGWADAWRQHFRPILAGRRLVITPPWEWTAPDGRHIVVIDPGRAFGTGHHGSTIGCLESLEAVLDGAGVDQVVDLGTGSGVLAIAAARFGVPCVLAVDHDPDAVACAVANVERNGVGDRVQCRMAEARVLTAPPAALVIANLLTRAHLDLAPTYPTRVAAGGRLILGGILEAEAAGVSRALVDSGFEPGGVITVDGWTALEFRRAPLHDRA
jgi:ribosomal protein L11 methyltransferase